MRLHIRHETFYAYETPLSYSVQRLYLTPQSYDAQKVVEWKITAPGIEGALTYLDGFGTAFIVTIQNIRRPDEHRGRKACGCGGRPGVSKACLPCALTRCSCADCGNAAQPSHSGCSKSR
jgi:hypothetical protein